MGNLLAVLAAPSLNPLGYIFGALERGLGKALAGLYVAVPVYGLDIILLTVIIRLILFPLMARSTRSMRKMQQLQPHMKRLQEKYKNDRQKLSEEQMALFRANKVSPVSGCLPLLIQMPIFFALYRVINANRGRKNVVPGAINVDFIGHTTELGKALTGSTMAQPLAAAMFLGMNVGVSPSQTLSAVTSGKVGTTPIPNYYHDWWMLIPQFLLVLAIVATGWYQQKQIQASNKDQPQQVPQAMQTVTKLFPLLFGFISFALPAGVNLYFLTSNCFQIGQQYMILRNKKDDEIVLPASLGGSAPSASAKKLPATSSSGKGRPGSGSKGTSGTPARKGGGARQSGGGPGAKKAAATKGGTASEPGMRKKGGPPQRVAPKSKKLSTEGNTPATGKNGGASQRKPVPKSRDGKPRGPS